MQRPIQSDLAGGCQTQCSSQLILFSSGRFTHTASKAAVRWHSSQGAPPHSLQGDAESDRLNTCRTQWSAALPCNIRSTRGLEVRIRLSLDSSWLLCCAGNALPEVVACYLDKGLL